jgi:hypothetical protein
MVFDVPEILAMALTALVIWIGAKDWWSKGRRR